MGKLSVKCVLTALALAAISQAGSIDFENPPSGLVPNSSFFAGTSVDADAQLTNQFESLGAIFNTIAGSPYAALIDLGTGHATSGTNRAGPYASTAPTALSSNSNTMSRATR